MMKELDEFLAAYGEHTDLLEACKVPYLAEIAPDAMKAWHRESQARRNSGIFDDKMRELIWLAGCFIARSVPAASVHMFRAMKAGATRDEIIETLLLSSLVASHTMLTDGLEAIEKTLPKAENS